MGTDISLPFPRPRRRILMIKKLLPTCPGRHISSWLILSENWRPQTCPERWGHLSSRGAGPSPLHPPAHLWTLFSCIPEARRHMPTFLKNQICAALWCIHSTWYICYIMGVVPTGLGNLPPALGKRTGGEGRQALIKHLLAHQSCLCW